MTLAAQYIEHLRSPRSNAKALAEALDVAGLAVEAKLVLAWAVGDELVDDVSIGAVPPADAATGSRWFDPCDLAIHVNIEGAWLALHPVARWQMRGFLAVAQRESRQVQVAAPYVAFDEARLVPPGDDLARCTEVTHGEATVYAWWLRKYLPHWLDWQTMAEEHPELLARFGLGREWCNGDPNDDGARITISLSTIDLDADETPEMQRGEFTRDLAIGFRTSVSHQVGLLPNIGSWEQVVEPVKLAALIDRSRY
ncbi:MAG: hypothetical protein QM831_44735 [Kofleriaceae bacterium]